MRIFIALGLILTLAFVNESSAITCEENLRANVQYFTASCPTTCEMGGGTIGVLKFETRRTLQGVPYLYVSCDRYTCGQSTPYTTSFYNTLFCSNDYNSAAKKSTPTIEYSKMVCGSIVQVENQIVGESIPLVGVNFTLNHFSNWVQGRVGDYELKVPIAGATPRDDIDSFNIKVERGSTVVQTANYTNNQPNVSFSYLWDGLDSLGNPTLGSQKYKVTVTENRAGLLFPIVTMVDLGSFKAKLLGLGGWVPSTFAFYDFNAGKLYKGDGTVRIVSATSGTGGHYYVPERESSRIYYFDSSGKVQNIKTGITGATILSFQYDSSGYLASMTEPFGKTTYFNRDSAGNLVSITAPMGQVTNVSLDSNGYLASVSNPKSETFTMTYWSTQDGLLHTFTKPQGQVSTFTYNAEGGLTKDQKSSGYFFDLVRNVIPNDLSINMSMISRMSRVNKIVTTASDGNRVDRTMTFASGHKENYTYNKSGSSAYETISSFGVNTSHYYGTDPRFGTVATFKNTETIQFGSVSRNTSYTPNITLNDPADPFSINTYQVTTQSGNYSNVVSFNPSTNTFSSTTSLGRTSEYQIDSYERPISVKIGNLTPLNISYSNEKLAAMTQGSRSYSLSYDSGTGLLSSIQNSMGQLTSYSYDSAGRVIGKTLPDLRVIGFSYDANGNIVGITPPGRSLHSFSLNLDEKLDSYNPPVLAGVSNVNTTYLYNNDKQLIQILQPNGNYITYDYNSTTGILQSIYTPGGTYNISMHYLSGLPGSITSPGSRMYLYYSGRIPTTIYQYNSSSQFIGSFSTSLTSQGLLSSDSVVDSSWTTSQISYAYDNDELLTSAGALTLTKNTPNGMLLGTYIGTAPNDVTDTYTYDNYGEITGYEAKHGSTVIYSLTLGRDGIGRINSKIQTMNGVTDTYDYVFDSTGRLTQVDKNSNTVATYGYDDNSNRNSGVISGQSTVAAYDAQDRMTAYNLYNFTYDANGGLTSKVNTLTSTTTGYVYDVFGNLTSVTLPNNDVITYEIDGLNRRFGKRLNGVLQRRWIYADKIRIAAELDGAGNTKKRFVYASKGNIPDYMIMGGENYRIISDHLGSPRLVVKVSDGTVIGRMDHDEFGRVTVNTNPGLLPFGFAGGMYDSETQLVRFGARDYDAETGRWTSKDPILFNGGDTNLYGYTFQDPVNFIDPRGTDACVMNQGTGTVICTNDSGDIVGISNGYSGSGAGRNNPSMVNVADVGPIPQGTYNIGAPYNQPGGTGNFTRSLNPTPETRASFPSNRNPDTFRWHGDNGQGTASQGCPISDRATRGSVRDGSPFSVINWSF